MLEFVTDHYVDIITTALAIAFSGWVVVVRVMGMRSLSMLETINERLIRLNENHLSLERDYRAHEAQRWHNGAAEHIGGLEARVRNLERVGANGSRPRDS